MLKRKTIIIPRSQNLQSIFEQVNSPLFALKLFLQQPVSATNLRHSCIVLSPAYWPATSSCHFWLSSIFFTSSLQKKKFYMSVSWSNNYACAISLDYLQINAFQICYWSKRSKLMLGILLDEPWVKRWQESSLNTARSYF